MSPADEMERTRYGSVSDEAWKHRTKLPKKLIVCCDGTWMDSDNGWVPGTWGRPGHLQNPTNITRIARAIKDEDEGHHPQIVFYQAGIGTGIGLWNHLVGGGTGMGIEDNIREAYAFLANNYSEHQHGVAPDSIFLLGFSRGAYTARSLGGLICALGLLKKRAMPHFYEMFYDWEMAGDKHHTPLFFNNYYRHHEDMKHVQQPPIEMARDKTRRDEYLRNYLMRLLELGVTQEAQIQCIGVFDTVGALGIPVNPVLQQFFPNLPTFIRRSRWFDTRLDHPVWNAFQALALDERRAPYSPAIWERRESDIRKSDRRTRLTRLKQVWFPGAHSNVGGSYSDAGTADITLAWMMDQLAGHTTEHKHGFVHHHWIKFDDAYVDHWYDCQLDYYKKHELSRVYRPWGRGKIYDSNTFPQSLAGKKIRAPGRTHRAFYESGKPDKNHLLENTEEMIHSCVRTRIDLAGRGLEPDVDKGDDWSFSKLLRMCWHLMKRCVKSRDIYQPQMERGPLHGWRLDDGHESHREPNMNLHTGQPMEATAVVIDGIESSEGENVEELLVEDACVRWVYDGPDPMVQGKFMLEDKLGPYERLLLRKDEEIANEVLFTNNGWREFEETHHWPVKPAKTF